eukprot:GDKI01015846.1.p1 GENE.GDKI01015846.1~~GDKI01015846.1.p1  ORF type:complete len:203 (-),score=22.66 GDKI01015846.1:201-809(-)
MGGNTNMIEVINTLKKVQPLFEKRRPRFKPRSPLSPWHMYTEKQCVYLQAMRSCIKNDVRTLRTRTRVWHWLFSFLYDIPMYAAGVCVLVVSTVVMAFLCTLIMENSPACVLLVFVYVCVGGVRVGQVCMFMWLLLCIFEDTHTVDGSLFYKIACIIQLYMAKASAVLGLCASVSVCACVLKTWVEKWSSAWETGTHPCVRF